MKTIYYKTKTKKMTVSKTTANTLKLLAFTILVPVLYYVQGVIPGWHVDPVIKIAISTAVAYILKLIVPALPTEETKTT